jgi:hypothetical protein
MYLWKSWHDSRDRVILYGAAGLAIGVIIGIAHINYFSGMVERYQRVLSGAPPHYFRRWNPDPVQLRQLYLDSLQHSWEWSLYQILNLMPMAAIWSALALGAMSVGRDYGSGAIGFVLTRPQSRFRIVWEEWALAIAEIGIILSMFYVGILPFLFYTSGRYVSPSPAPLLGILAVAACICGLTQFLTMLTGSSMKGLSAAVAVCLFYVMLPDALDAWWHIRWPAEVRDLSLAVVDNIGWENMPVLQITLIWAMVALIFPVLSQWLIERREV